MVGFLGVLTLFDSIKSDKKVMTDKWTLFVNELKRHLTAPIYVIIFILGSHFLQMT